MSLRDARRVLQWNVVMAALTEAGVDAETVAMVESARNAGDVAHSLTGMLLGTADVKQAKNYVKFEMVGLVAPFERAYVELVRPGGKTSHELRELLRDRLVHIRRSLTSEHMTNDAFIKGLIQGIDEDLTSEAP